MDKQQFINQCRYYKGEKENPFENVNQDKTAFWFYESKWVDMCVDKSNNLSTYISEYNASGLYDFEKKDGTPRTLKALLFNRFTHWCCGDYRNPTAFKEWYMNSYIANS